MSDFDGEVFASGLGDGTHPDQAFCSCGSAWFKALISIEHDLHVNGYIGPLECASCGDILPLGWVGAKNQDGSWYDPIYDP